MTQCLERVLASDYKKLEIIVFDDSSADDTSILVRSFAHAGVRFVPGTALPKGWLGKNHALDVLAREASGTYALFLDVDTFIQPTTISRMVGRMAHEKLEMLSVIPQRTDIRRASVLLGTLRYFWLLILNRPKMPAAACAAWIVNREALLKKADGLTLYKNTVNPEAYIAALFGRTYRCVISNEELGVSYEKKWQSQLETSRRVLYPTVGGTPSSAILGFVVLALLNLPSATLLSGFIFGWTETQAMAFWMTSAFMALYGVYTSYVWRGKWWLGGLLWPVVVFQELILFVQSVWGYTRHTTKWKGRNVAIAASPANSIKIDR